MLYIGMKNYSLTLEALKRVCERIFATIGFICEYPRKFASQLGRTMKFELLLESPYNLPRCALVFGQFPSDGTDVWVPPREVLPAQHHRLHVVEDEAILAITQQNELSRLTGRTYPERPKHLSILKARVNRQFHPDAPLEEFYRRVENYPLFRPIIKNLYGVKPLCPPSLYEMAVIAITEQQLSYHLDR